MMKVTVIEQVEFWAWSVRDFLIYLDPFRDWSPCWQRDDPYLDRDKYMELGAGS